MPDHQRFGPDKDGNVFPKEFMLNLITNSGSYFGYLVDCFQDLEARDWQDKHAKYIHYKDTVDKDTGIVTKREKIPFPRETDEEYHDAYTKRKEWDKSRSEFEREGPTIISYLLDGTMTRDTRALVMAKIEANNIPILPTIRRKNDILPKAP